MPLRCLRVAGPLVPLAVVLAGCASPPTDEATATASTFVRLAAAQPGDACAMLAPSTRKEVEDDGDGDCAKGLKSANLPSASTASSSAQPAEVAGHTSLVRLSDQVVFLSRFDDGWKVLAAGCTRASGDISVPYECAVKGG